MTARQVQTRAAGHQLLDTLVAGDIPDLSATYDATGAAATAQSAAIAAAATDATTKANAAQAAAIASAATDATTKANAAAAASQPLDSDLTAFAGLAIASDKLPYGTGSHTLGLADFTAAGRALVDDAAASDQRTTLGLGTLATQSGTFSGTSSGTNTGDQTIPVGGTPAVVLGTANTAGTSPNFLRRDDTILAFDATTPAAVGTAAVGAATTTARRDHVHATGAGTPSTQAFGDAAATGTGPAASMTDHKHAMMAAPTSVSGNAGTVTTNANLTGVVTSSGNATNVQGLYLPYRTGGTFYYTAPGGTGGSLVLVQNTMYAFPFFVPVTTTFDSIAVMTAAGVGSSAARLGIYSDTAGVPNALVLDAGSVATTTGGTKAIAISQSLTAGWYWLACAVQGAAGNLWTMSAGNYRGVVPTTAPFSGDNAGYSVTGVSGTLPSPWGATKTEITRVPFVWVAPH